MTEMMNKSKKIRKGDRVIAISGNSKGQVGTVQACIGDKIVVEGLNMRKKHIKPSRDVPKGRIIDLEMPINVSNLKLIAEDNLPIKTKVRVNEQNERHLVYRSGGQEVVYRSVKKPK